MNSRSTIPGGSAAAAKLDWHRSARVKIRKAASETLKRWPDIDRSLVSYAAEEIRIAAVYVTHRKMRVPERRVMIKGVVADFVDPPGRGGSRGLPRMCVEGIWSRWPYFIRLASLSLPAQCGLKPTLRKMNCSVGFSPCDRESIVTWASAHLRTYFDNQRRLHPMIKPSWPSLRRDVFAAALWSRGTRRFPTASSQACELVLEFLAHDRGLHIRLRSSL